MKKLHFIQPIISLNLKDPHSKALEPDCLPPFARNYDTVSRRRGLGNGKFEKLEMKDEGFYDLQKLDF